MHVSHSKEGVGGKHNQRTSLFIGMQIRIVVAKDKASSKQTGWHCLSLAYRRVIEQAYLLWSNIHHKNLNDFIHLGRLGCAKD